MFGSESNQAEGPEKMLLQRVFIVCMTYSLFYDLINRSGVVTHGQLPLVDNLRFVGGIKNEINAAAQSVVVSTRQAVGLS